MHSFKDLLSIKRRQNLNARVGNLFWVKKKVNERIDESILREFRDFETQGYNTRARNVYEGRCIGSTPSAQLQKMVD